MVIYVGYFLSVTACHIRLLKFISLLRYIIVAVKHFNLHSSLYIYTFFFIINFELFVYCNIKRSIWGNVRLYIFWKDI